MLAKVVMSRYFGPTSWILLIIIILLLKIIIKILYFLVTKLMTTVVGLTGLKLAPRSLSSNKSWASGDEMAKEASESDDYFGGMWLKVK